MEQYDDDEIVIYDVTKTYPERYSPITEDLIPIFGININKGCKILDAGGYTGVNGLYVSNYFYSKGVITFSIDVTTSKQPNDNVPMSPESMTLNAYTRNLKFIHPKRNYSSRHHLINGSYTALPFPNKSLDLIITANTISYEIAENTDLFEDENFIYSRLGEMFRVMANGSSLIIFSNHFKYPNLIIKRGKERFESMDQDLYKQFLLKQMNPFISKGDVDDKLKYDSYLCKRIVGVANNYM